MDISTLLFSDILLVNKGDRHQIIPSFEGQVCVCVGGCNLRALVANNFLHVALFQGPHIILIAGYFSPRNPLMNLTICLEYIEFME